MLPFGEDYFPTEKVLKNSQRNVSASKIKLIFYVLIKRYLFSVSISAFCLLL